MFECGYVCMRDGFCSVESLAALHLASHLDLEADM